MSIPYDEEWNNGSRFINNARTIINKLCEADDCKPTAKWLNGTAHVLFTMYRFFFSLERIHRSMHNPSPNDRFTNRRREREREEEKNTSAVMTKTVVIEDLVQNFT